MFIKANEENYVIEVIAIYIQKSIILNYYFREIPLLSQYYKYNWRR
jgi:hypothetical protein